MEYLTLTLSLLYAQIKQTFTEIVSFALTHETVKKKYTMRKMEIADDTEVVC